MRRFVLGDIHGEYDLLNQVLEKSGINPETDLLIQIGDIVDRGPEPFKCMDKLLEFKNLILLMGNHDQSFIQYISSGIDMLGDYPQNGTYPTKKKWSELTKDQKRDYIDNIFLKMEYYHITRDGILFVHAGFDRTISIKDQIITTYTWDRELVKEAMSCHKDQKLKTIEEYKDIFIGHTPTIYWNKLEPIYSGGIWNIDTGSGKGGPLTIMDIDSKEYWQSEIPEKFKKYVIIGEKNETQEQENSQT